jgi:hypothetical protein
LLLVWQRRQEQPRASLRIEMDSTKSRVGETVAVTVRLKNEGRIGLGLPQYRLYVEAEQELPVLEPRNPASVEHYLQVGAGQSDSAVFELQAARAGRAALRASVSYEVHMGYPGPAYWGGASAGPIVLTVLP